MTTILTTENAILARLDRYSLFLINVATDSMEDIVATTKLR